MNDEHAITPLEKAIREFYMTFIQDYQRTHSNLDSPYWHGAHDFKEWLISKQTALMHDMDTMDPQTPKH